ncbi:HAD family hydrolase [Exiguobacterium aquaticum]|uniref:HAD family hydrolase n=3 Tax=Bacillales Family XII. Incertae Sedis TaxID=539742 RepID=UPI001BE7CA6E|nr:MULTISPECIES: HAD family hydrolase [Exiguobacterium]MCT4776803.1 HAD family hydrolase [Exiguobacterium aquaticum]
MSLTQTIQTTGVSALKAVLFDLDGTLLNRDESVRRFIHDQYTRLKGHLTGIEERDYVTRFIELDHHGYRWKDAVYDQLIQEFEISGITRQELLDDYVNRFQHFCVAFPNLKPMLSALKARGLRLGIITNGSGEFQMKSIRGLGIHDYFDCILVSEWEGMKKPDPELFQRALERLDVTPGTAMFVGDHALHDIQAAKRVGMRTVWKRNDRWEESDAGADESIDDLSELIVMR